MLNVNGSLKNLALNLRCFPMLNIFSLTIFSSGPREQLNQLTSYLDASHIYGSNMEQMDKLRDKRNSGMKL